MSTTNPPPTPDDGDPGAPPEERPGRSPNAEAAARRRQLREVEAERDSLIERLCGMQRAEAARLAGRHLAVGADLFDVGRVELADLLDDDGNLSPDAVENAAQRIAADRPGLLRPGMPDMGAGRRGSAPSRPEGWAGLFGR